LKLHFTARKAGKLQCEADYNITDGVSFGRACSDLWVRIANGAFRKSGSVGAVYEAIGENGLADLDGVQLTITRSGE
jgi:hypothetical protein